ncbi:hypothetical protein NSS79_25915 [Paenibacillus sp. FSL L8-0436]|uniref:hypothetical protein n=1 Tax=Paenibacillus sp. FSL L8-0436 TaxID=2954686 RepID=UPI00315849CE
MGKVYYTDGIDSFMALHGFEEAVRIVSKILEISFDEARKRVEFAQKHNSNEI